jgi:hypothetical protein
MYRVLTWLNIEAYLYKMAPVARIQVAPPLKYLKLCLSLLDLLSEIYIFIH